jgi:predicted aldo/keto reductase-like oxidoreductase
MFPVNPAFDMLPGDVRLDEVKLNESYDQAKLTKTKPVIERLELYHTCAVRSVAIVAMKPYAAGRLFTQGNPSGIILTPIQCLNYALSQPGVCTVAPGCKNADAMEAALSFLNATEEEKDYSVISQNPVWRLAGSCMYCNHCLPCPFGIDIGAVTRLLDTADYQITDEVVAEYTLLPAKASDCTECGICLENCPFGVDIISNMTRAHNLFGT